MRRCNGRNIRNAKITRDKCLKGVEFREFTNVGNQWELVEQIFKIPQSLEKMVLDLDSEGFREVAEEIITDAKSLLAPGIKSEVRKSSA